MHIIQHMHSKHHGSLFTVFCIILFAHAFRAGLSRMLLTFFCIKLFTLQPSCTFCICFCVCDIPLPAVFKKHQNFINFHYLLLYRIFPEISTFFYKKSIILQFFLIFSHVFALKEQKATVIKRIMSCLIRQRA